MHVLPQLRKLEQKYPDELAVIGVHSAKFPSERNTASVHQAIRRYEIRHPVVNDNEFQVWQQYGVRAWPTIMFLDPNGRIIGSISGEASFERLDGLLQEMVTEFDEKGMLDRTPLHLSDSPDGGAGQTALSFPGKLITDEPSNRLFISDSNHNRIIVASLDGEVKAVIGSGEQGIQDGDFSSAQFNHPQGLALAGETLYVADTENHAIRRVDLAGGAVETVAGSGQQAGEFHIGGAGKEVELNSPWDLVHDDGWLYIAMAGFHQLWDMDLSTGEIQPIAGTGREGLLDGPVEYVWLAQPSGITTDGRRLYFADSETSSVRMMEPGEDGRVDTIVGRDLFEFGDVDGVGDDVRLQHPIGIAVLEGALYVADTYNNKIKRVVPEDRSAEAVAGKGEVGFRDGWAGDACFDEPGGIHAAGNKLYIADTNNHAIRVLDLETEQVSTLELSGL